MRLDRKGKTIISITLILIAILLLIIISTTGDLSCQIESSCTNQGTALLYLQNDSGGYDNAHAENVSYATYANVLCCNSTNNTLTTFCGTGQTFLNLSNETNAHVEYTGYDNYTNASCINVEPVSLVTESTQVNMSCSIEPTGCPSDSTCMLSMASDGPDNKTNAHVSSCGVYDTQICCHINTRATVVGLNAPLNYSNFSAFPEFSWSNSTDADNNDIYYLLEIDDSPLFPQPLKYSNVSILETDNTTEDISIGNSLTTAGHYFWRVLATDLEDNSSAWSDVWFFTYDHTPPAITITYPGNTSILYTKDDGTEGATLYINFTVEEPTVMQNTIDAAWWINSSGTVNSTEFATVEDYNSYTRFYAINITDWGPDGEINVSVWANDSAGNEYAIDYYVYTILTESKPGVAWISPELQDGNPILVNNGFDILVNITSNATAGGFATINYTWLEVDYPNGTIVNLTMDNSSETEYYYNFTADFPDGFYNMRAYSNYTETGQEGTAGTVLMREIDNTAPNITASDITIAGSPTPTTPPVFYNNSWSKYGDIAFWFAVSDNRTCRDGLGWCPDIPSGSQHSIASCNLTYFDSPGGENAAFNVSSSVITIDVDQNLPLAGESVNTLTDGNYNWTITCTDQIGNIGNDTNIKVINVDLTPPDITELSIGPNPSEFYIENVTVNWSVYDLNWNYTSVNVTYPNGSLMEGFYEDNFTLDSLTNLTDLGNYTIILFANDSADNTNMSIDSLFVNDTIPPDVELNAPTNETKFNINTVNFEFNTSDYHNVTNCTLYINDVENETNASLSTDVTTSKTTLNEIQTITVTNLPDQNNLRWNVTCQDWFNNLTNTSVEWSIDVDTTPPTLDVWTSPGENEVISKNQTINVTVTDALHTVNSTWVWINDSSDGDVLATGANYTMNKDGETNDYLYGWNTPDTVDGIYTLIAYYNDTGGIENYTERKARVDNSGPNITLESPPNNSISGDEGQTFQSRVWDFSTITNCSLIINDQANVTITSSIRNYSLVGFSTSLTDGVYEWTVNCTDEVNNIATNATTYTRTVDLTNPMITLTVPTSPLEFYLENASINWSIEEPNIDINYTTITMPDGTDLGTRTDQTTYYYENLTDLSELSAQDNLTLLGTYLVSTYVKDVVGHQVTSDSSFVVRDTIAPDVVIISPENGTLQNSSDITFSFNVSDYHSVNNCTLWLNQTEGYTNTTITNDITITQNINLTSIADEENVPWNITCYDTSSNNNNTETAIYIDIDTTPPLFEFISPTDLNNSYVSRNSTYINVSITEPHNDTVTIVWNYTTNHTSGIEEITITPTEGKTILYEINITNLTEGGYEYYIFANDTLANESEGHHNTSEVRTITIDETQPSTFDLLDPSNGTELTDDTPAFNWEDTIDINFDNYSLEASTDGNFTTIDKTFSTTTVSYYALQESDALSSGIWYWRVRAIDKANNQRNSTSTFQFTIGNVSKPTTFVIGPGGGGGGAGGKKIVYGVVDIIQPGMQTAYEGETITTPVIIQNTGDGPIRGITLKATSDSPAISLDLSKAYIEFLSAGQQESISLKIIAKGVVGEYEVTVKAEATEPKITDQAKFYVNLIGFGLGKKTILEEKLRFVGKLFESNPECLELREMVEEAKKELEEKDYDKSLEIIEVAIKSCEELVKTVKKKVLEKPAEPKRTLQILIAEIILFILVFITIYRYYRKRAYKGLEITKKGKSATTMIIILIFLSGFFFLKDYTGLTMFEDISASDFNLGTHANTTTSGDNVILTSGSTLGNFTSRVFNANFTVEWQTINWSWASSTDNDNITMDVRTSFDNITWSSWSENVTNDTKIPDAKTVWTEEEDFIGTLTGTNITNPSGNITLNTDGTTYSEAGTFTSASLDLGFIEVNITTIEFTITNTSSEDNITIETSTSADNTTWEDWVQANVSGDQVFSTDNKYFKWRATLVTNDTGITPALEDLMVNYERNSTYIQYKATLSTNDNTKTPYLAWVNITYQDANLPLFKFLTPTEENNTYTTNNFTYINFTITEPNNDSFYFWWNGTEYNSTEMNETAELSEGVYVYAINLTELLEGPYEYYIWANDTYGHENQTENFTITVDQTLPTSFNLLNPSDENRSTDTTPFLLWEDSNDTNFDNYTLQFATDTSFSSIVQTYYNTSSNYQIQDSEALPSNGTFYWRVIAYDKAGQNYTTPFFVTYYVGYEETTAFAPGTAGEGGGGGKSVERRQVGLELIKPSALSFFANRQIIIPLLLTNTGTEILQGIELTAESPDLELELKNNFFPILRPNQEIDPQLVVKPVESPGRYDIIVKAKVASPEFTDAIMFIVDIVEFGLGNRTEAEEKLTFVVDFIKSHDECAELEKSVIDAKEAFKKNEFDLVLSLTEQAIQGCKDLVSTAKEKKLEKRKRPAWQYYVPLIEGLLFLLVFSGVYSYYKRLKFKRRKYW